MSFYARFLSKWLLINNQMYTLTGKDTWGSYALTLVDALDTLYLLENFTEFDYAVAEVAVKVNLAIDRNVSVFETNIRILGGMLKGLLSPSYRFFRGGAETIYQESFYHISFLWLETYDALLEPIHCMQG